MTELPTSLPPEQPQEPRRDPSVDPASARGQVQGAEAERSALESAAFASGALRGPLAEGASPAGRRPARSAAAALGLDPEWQRVAGRLRQVALSLDGDAAAVARVQQAFDRGLERELAALRSASPLRFPRSLRERLNSSTLVRLVAASVLLHLCALPVLAYLWWRPADRTGIQVEFPPPREPLSAYPEIASAPEALRAPTAPQPLSALASQAAALDEALRLDRFRRSQLVRSVPAGLLASDFALADPAGAWSSPVPELARLLHLRLAGLVVPAGNQAAPARERQLLPFEPVEWPQLRWAHWSVACHQRLDLRADLEAPGQRTEGRAEALAALEAELCSQIARVPDSSARRRLQPAEIAMIEDVLARAADFGLCEPQRGGTYYAGDPRRWLRQAVVLLSAGYAGLGAEPGTTVGAEVFAQEPWSTWMSWARTE